MKKIVAFICCILFFISFAAAQSQQANMKKPVKKIPAKEGNFEVIEGKVITSPINIDKFHTSALRAFTKLGYQIEEDTPGVILVKLSKPAWWLKLKLCYWNDEYWYEYVDSLNLDANPGKNRIHKNYYRWITNLEKTISDYYYYE